MRLVKNVSSRIINFSNRYVDPEVNKVYRETWPIRRAVFENDRKGKIPMATITFNEWKKLTEGSKTLVCINGPFVHSFVFHHKELFMDYKKFADGFKAYADRIYYFSANKEDSNLVNFFHYLSFIENIEPVIRTIPNLPTTENNRIFDAFRTVAVDMACTVLEKVFTDENINHVLFMTRDPDIIPLMTKLNELDVRVSLAHAKDMPMNRHLLQSANFTVDLDSILSDVDCYSTSRQISSKEEKAAG